MKSAEHTKRNGKTKVRQGINNVHVLLEELRLRDLGMVEPVLKTCVFYLTP